MRWKGQITGEMSKHSIVSTEHSYVDTARVFYYSLALC